jgi:hypothetical protein
MRREYSQQYLVLIAVVDKVHRYIRAMAVKDQEAVLSLSFLLREAIKDLFKLSKA